MGLSRALATIAAALCIAALLAAAWAPRSSARAFDLAAAQLAEELRDNHDYSPHEVPVPPGDVASALPRPREEGVVPFLNTGLGPRVGHFRLPLRPPNG